MTMSRMTSKRDIVIEPGEVKEPSKGNVLKFGITSPLREGDKGVLVFLQPEQPLSDAIAQVCHTWGFPDPSIFALKYNDPPYHYITDSTRKEISGKLVSMQYSPIKVCQEILEKFKSTSPAVVESGLKELADKASDPTLADVFVTAVDGLTVLIELVEKEKLIEREKSLQYALQALLDIMLHSTHATWDKLQPSVISRIAGYVNSPRGLPQERLALRVALQVLESVVTAGNAVGQVEREITLPNLMKHIENKDSSVQQNVLSLINALLSKADSSRRKHLTGTLSTRNYRDKIIDHVIKKPGENRPAETNHQLYVLQTLMLNSLDSRRNIPVDPQDQDYQESLNKIKDLCKIAFDSDIGTVNFGSSMELNGGTNTKREKPNFSRDYKRLGFQNDINPAQDFSEIPPGILALDCMHYLASNHTDTYNKIVLETASRGIGDECPFARSAIALTALLCDILKVGTPPGDNQGKFYPFFFQFDRPFEELFCVCATLVTKTWKEMRATVEDFDKVFDVVREQIKRALDRVPESLQFTDLRSELNKLTYTEITNLRQKERFDREDGEAQAKPIQELRKKLVPEMMELIKQNRLNYLIAGTRFNRYVQKGIAMTRMKEKFWFCRLSPNGKYLHYGDCEEKATPTPEELSSKVSVNDLQDLLVGRDCHHVKDKKKSNAALAFSLVTEREPLQSIDFVAPDEKSFDLWTDGINALLGKEMVSKEAKSDLEILLNMEVKLRLLDIEGVPEIPQEPPAIPELPSDLDFSAFINAK